MSCPLNGAPESDLRRTKLAFSVSPQPFLPIALLVSSFSIHILLVAPPLHQKLLLFLITCRLPFLLPRDPFSFEKKIILRISCRFIFYYALIIIELFFVKWSFFVGILTLFLTFNSLMLKSIA